MFADLAFIFFRAFFTQSLQSQKETNEPLNWKKISYASSKKTTLKLSFKNIF